MPDIGQINSINQSFTDARRADWLLDPDPQLVYTPFLDKITKSTNEMDFTQIWTERPLYGVKDTLHSEIAADATSMTVHNVTWFKQGYLCRIGNELVITGEPNFSTSAVPITRAYGGTTAAIHADNLDIHIFGPVIGESWTTYPQYGSHHTAAPTEIKNYAQHWFIDMSITEKQQWQERNGKTRYKNSNYLDTQRRLIKQNMEMAAVYGIPTNSTDATLSSTMGGVKHYIDTYGYTLACTDNKLTYNSLNSLAIELSARGGQPDFVICDMATKQTIDEGWGEWITRPYGTSSIGNPINSIKLTPGLIELLPIPRLPANTVLFVSTRDINLGPVAIGNDSMGFRKLTQTLGSVTFEAYDGWYNMQVNNIASSHAALSFTTISTDGK